ncbi:MAG: 16S rRNA (cytidine(1402)-2'-O)-methyltransferase [Liquorilactobacillus nagelii]|jgi:16S rRNA (cytidine1402-2'-O)-methyltransferase|uniref:16S rRNA (cytidine(1402)-2'-O)-methyltransferase n=1 Tax=Liquorilactobacillus nagelii TaxID=82688 RepID=UPI00242EF3E7|nr:16S rRNA (cytidine(1402)-2'-O)-methyltransferase [Liquorilactobacillus nagelii]MCI1921819.1 16S rRNA (cytidine(1402)-2'-O)-methyltransferase [Liquorilactobacillus nagelii]MCI1976769.1 16S rRNA (cytidine(1402)-2'-O)-methyltransferase [Liquorilactobacillus nagelii]
MGLTAISSYQQPKVAGALYLVPTPLGNLGDMTFRAVEILKKVDLIAAEDTRNTQKLLNYFDIKTPQISFHEHNTQERIPQLLDKLMAGKKIAQVSDAGMPSISDPGHELVVAAIAQQIPVIPLPGPNAGLTALIASGLVPQPFLFFGFLARQKKQRQQQTTFLAQQEVTFILYESPHHLKKTLQELNNVLGAQRQIVLGRELTKKFEEFLRGTLADALAWSQEEQIRGEFCLIVAGKPVTSAPQQIVSSEDLENEVADLIASGEYRANDAIKQIAKQHQLKKQVVYNAFHHLRKG